MSNPFEDLVPKVKPDDVEYDEWEGQFDCQDYPCTGYARVAKYIKKQRVLAWECQYGHISRVENMDE